MSKWHEFRMCGRLHGKIAKPAIEADNDIRKSNNNKIKKEHTHTRTHSKTDKMQNKINFIEIGKPC